MEMVVVGNVTFTDHPAGPDRSAFVGTLDQITDDVHTAAEAGADELIIDLNLQDWFTSTRQMLETAVEIRERAASLSRSYMRAHLAPCARLSLRSSVVLSMSGRSPIRHRHSAALS